MPYYVYRPLNSPTTIRLLQIVALCNKAELSKRDTQREPRESDFLFTLVHTTIEDAPPYEALSYVWGKTTREEVLKVGEGTRLGVTSSVKDALPQIAYHCKTGYLWIDQVCINQEDLDERSHQVSLMGDIYSGSMRVIVWLGVIVGITDRLREILNAAGQHHLQQTRRPTEEELKPLRTRIRGLCDRSRRQLDASVLLQEFRDILGMAWFTRAWVFQEAVLGPSTEFIICAQIAYPVVSNMEQSLEEGRANARSMVAQHWTARKWRTKATVVSLPGMYWTFACLSDLHSRQTHTKEGVRTGKGCRTLVEMYHRWAEKHYSLGKEFYVPFEGILSKVVHGAQTSNELDRLYAFFGLNSMCAIKLQPNYKHTFDKATFSTTVSIIKGTSSLDIFETVPRKWTHTLPMLAAPSWAPDLRYEQIVIPFQKTHAEGWSWDEEEGKWLETDGKWVQADSWTRDENKHLNRITPSDRELSRTWHVPNHNRRMYPWRGLCDETYLRCPGKALDIVETKIGGQKLYNDNESDLQNLLMMANEAWARDCGFQRSNRDDILVALNADSHCKPSSETFLHPITPEELIDHDQTEQRMMKPGVRFKAAISPPVVDPLNTSIIMQGRRLWTTTEGRFATSSHLEPGDIICVLHGCSNPVALRRERFSVYKVLGTCYLEGWMDPWSNEKVYWEEEDADHFLLI